MSLLIAFVILVLWCFPYHFWTKKIFRKEIAAFDLHCDMYDKYLELCEDFTMTKYKWESWLPVFQLADEFVAKNYPRHSLGNVSEFVLGQIYES